MSQEVTYRVTVHEDAPDSFWAEVTELPGCIASGSSFEELQEALREAIALYLSTEEHTTVVGEPVWTQVGATTEQDVRVSVGA